MTMIATSIHSRTNDHAALSIMLLSCLAVVVSSFGTTLPLLSSTTTTFLDASTTRSRVAPLHAAGMGMAVTPKTKKKKKGKKRFNNKSSPKAPPFDANASLMRLEKRYDELSRANAKAIQQDNDDVVTSEYVVAARAADTSVADWVPVVQMCIARPLADAASSQGVTDPTVQAVVSHFCREIFEAATLSAPVFKSLPRNKIEYSVESLDSFHKHVYETIVEGNSEKPKDEIMSKSDARTTLKLDAGVTDMTVIKTAYRTLSFELHPDRFARTDEVQVQSASDEYARVKLAYETLSSGVRSSDGSSWYESLGGRARTEFVGPLTLLSLAKAKDFLSLQPNLDSAVVGLDPEMAQTFVVRNQAAPSS